MLCRTLTVFCAVCADVQVKRALLCRLLCSHLHVEVGKMPGFLYKINGKIKERNIIRQAPTGSAVLSCPSSVCSTTL